jgi:hypothetical protein
MKRDPKLVIGGYNVPSGAGRVAVAAAIYLIKQNPGVKQVDVQKHAVRFSGLNSSTAGWVTSPGVKSPATILWDRRKEGVFRCYPNENTALFNLDPVQLASDICKREMAESIQVKVGDLVQVKTYRATEPGILVGFRLYGGWDFQQFSKGTPVSGIFTDPSFLDNAWIWGYGIPNVSCVINTSSGLSDWPAACVRANDAAA